MKKNNHSILTISVFVFSLFIKNVRGSEQQLQQNIQSFKFGVASTAFQVEGTPLASDWKTWTHTPHKINDLSDADTSTDFWNRYEEDIELAKKLGCKAFRISIAWERIFPNKNEFNEKNLKKYEKIIESIKKAGMEPMVTLLHFVLPEWLAQEGGLTSPDFPRYFSELTLKVVPYLSKNKLVTHWMTFNEPNVQVMVGYMLGIWPPGKKNDMKSASLSTFHLAKAHLLAVSELYKNDPKLYQTLNISVALHWRIFQGNLKFKFLNKLVEDIFNKSFNHQLLESIQSGNIDISFLGGESYNENFKLPNGIKTINSLSLNYYGRSIISLSFKPPFFTVSEGPNEPKSDFKWEIYPEGIYNTVIDAYQKFKLPILISENGVADEKDLLRTKFIKDHLFFIKKAINEGIPITGYLYWSLTDNFEWAEGKKMKFGLVEIDYITLQRKPRKSFYDFQKIIKEF